MPSWPLMPCAASAPTVLPVPNQSLRQAGSCLSRLRSRQDLLEIAGGMSYLERSSSRYEASFRPNPTCTCIGRLRVELKGQKLLALLCIAGVAIARCGISCLCGTWRERRAPAGSLRSACSTPAPPCAPSKCLQVLAPSISPSMRRNSIFQLFSSPCFQAAGIQHCAETF